MRNIGTLKREMPLASATSRGFITNQCKPNRMFCGSIPSACCHKQASLPHKHGQSPTYGHIMHLIMHFMHQDNEGGCTTQSLARLTLVDLKSLFPPHSYGGATVMQSWRLPTQSHLGNRATAKQVSANATSLSRLNTCSHKRPHWPSSSSYEGASDLL